MQLMSLEEQQFIFSLHHLEATTPIFSENVSKPTTYKIINQQTRIELPLPNYNSESKLDSPLTSVFQSPIIYSPDEQNISQLISNLLWATYACHKIRVSLPILYQEPEKTLLNIMTRRVIAAGGACYPVEIYLHVGKQYNTLSGTYYYSPIHHALITKQEELPIEKPDEEEIQINLAINLSRSKYKYHDFAYRLTAVDLGFVVGRLCHLLSAFNLEFRLYPKFANSSFTYKFQHVKKCQPNYTTIIFNPKKSIKSSKYNLHLLELIKAITNRASRAVYFTAIPTSKDTVEKCLQETLISYKQIMRNLSIKMPSLHLYCMILHVSHIQPGIYYYDQKKLQLTLIDAKDFSAEIQDCLHRQTANISKSSFMIHIAGPIIPQSTEHYCIQQMLIGAMLDAASLLASHQQLSAHPYLGFSTWKIKKIYKNLDETNDILAQLCVGYPSREMHMETSIYEENSHV